jgi:hypothetical protein
VGWLNPACDYICQMFIRERTGKKKVKVKVGDKEKEIEQIVKLGGVDYCLRTAPDAVYTTKFRLPKGHALPECIVDPDYDKLVKLIGG